MTFLYRIDNSKELRSSPINSFEDFVGFLWENKVGKDKDDQRILAFWKEDYDSYRTKPFEVERYYNRTRARKKSTLVLCAVEDFF